MTFTNGYIEPIQGYTGEPSYDDDGNPIADADGQAGELIGCNWQAAQKDKQGRYVDGKFEQAKYVIMIDLQEFAAERLRLYDDRREIIGEYEVQHAERLIFLNTLKILCQ